MCGRTCLSLNKDQMRSACCYKPRGKAQYAKPKWLDEYNDGKLYEPSVNIAPTDVTPVLISGYKLKEIHHDERVIIPMMWSIMPHWQINKPPALCTHNCRLETITTSKLYSRILRKGGRCVVAVEGFYEWQTTKKVSKVKQPYYIYAPQKEGVKIEESDTWQNNFSEEDGWKGVKLMYMAGLYHAWQSDNRVVYSYSIITMESNSTFNWLHHRMPAILDTEEQISAWLDVNEVNADMALSYLKPSSLLTWHEVSKAVNSSRNKSPECNKRLKKTANSTSQKSITAWLVNPEKRKSSGETSNPAKKGKAE